jgi:hypothetical protein
MIWKLNCYELEEFVIAADAFRIGLQTEMELRIVTLGGWDGRFLMHLSHTHKNRPTSYSGHPPTLTSTN